MGKTGRRVTTQNTIAGLLFGLLLLGIMAYPLPKDEFREQFKLYLTLQKKGQYRKAIPVAKRTLELGIAKFGKDHQHVGTCLNNLAELYRVRGLYEQAEPLYKRSLKIKEKTLGSQHPSVATTLNNLAGLYKAQKLYAQAEPLYKKAIILLEKADPNHPSIRIVVSNLANLYHDTKQPQKAAHLEKRLGRVVFFGSYTPAKEWPELYNRFLAMNKAGKYREAIPIIKHILELSLDKFGENHQIVGVCLNNLADLYSKQGLYKKAELLYKRSLNITEKALGKQHPEIAITLNNLALLYTEQGLYAQAEPLYKRSLNIIEKNQVQGRSQGLVFIPKDQRRRQQGLLAATLNNLAAFYESQARYAEAESLFKRSLKIGEKVLEQQHPSVAATLNNLAGLYESQGRYGEAEPLYKRSLKIKEKVSGGEHPSIAGTLNNLAGLYESQGRYAEAESVYKRSLKIGEKVLGREHPSIATMLNNFAGLYKAQGRYAEVEPLYKGSLKIYEKALRPQHPSVAATLNNLAELYETQGRYAEAEPLYRRALQISEKSYDVDHPNIRTTLKNLADLYRDTKQPDKAAPLEKRLSMMAVPGTKDAILLYATNRVMDGAKSSSDNQRFSGGRGTRLSFGMARVQMSGKLLKALAKRGLQNLTNDKLRNQGVLTSAEDLTIRSAVKLEDRDALFAKAKIALNHSSVNKNQILIFVHGYNVSFEDALKRAAQIKLDMGFDGAIIPFSWPSTASLAGYGTDRDSADIAVNHLFRFY